MSRSHTLELLDHRFADISGGKDSLESVVRHQRYQGRSWRYISGYVFAQTGVNVSYEALRSWFPDS